MKAHEFNVTIEWVEGRRGLVLSPEVSESPFEGAGIEVATPPQFPQGIAGMWSPEHLFTAAVASCLMTTFLAIAENFKLKFSSFSCVAKGKLELVNGSWEMTEVNMVAITEINDESQRELAVKVIQRSEKACLISNSVKSKVTVQAEVRVAEDLAVQLSQ